MSRYDTAMQALVDIDDRLGGFRDPYQNHDIQVQITHANLNIDVISFETVEELEDFVRYPNSVMFRAAKACDLWNVPLPGYEDKVFYHGPDEDED